MTNRVKEAALKVLKEYEHRISIKQIGESYADFELLIKDVADARYGEVFSALDVLSYDCGIGHEGNSVRVLSNNESEVALCRNHPITMHPVGDLARTLADGGINFSGSDRFKSKRVG